MITVLYKNADLDLNLGKDTLGNLYITANNQFIRLSAVQWSAFKSHLLELLNDLTNDRPNRIVLTLSNRLVAYTLYNGLYRITLLDRHNSIHLSIEQLHWLSKQIDCGFDISVIHRTPINLQRFFGNLPTYSCTSSLDNLSYSTRTST